MLKGNFLLGTARIIMPISASIPVPQEKDMISATNQMKELSERLLQLDSKSKDCQDREKEALKEVDEWKQKYENCTAELQSLTG